MSGRFRLHSTARFAGQAARLPAAAWEQLKTRLRLLEENPRHQSLNTHEVQGARGDFGGKVFEAYVNLNQRFTWEYGPRKGDITLRNVDSHDACLRKP